MSQLVNGTLSMTGACNTGECPAAMEGSVRCVLDLDSVYGLILFCIRHTCCFCNVKCSSATDWRALLTALHSATGILTAARALQTQIATRTVYGQEVLQRLTTTITESCRMGVIMSLILNMLATPFLCAVSWI